MDKPVAGAEIDGYRLVRPIGQGGFGTVWLCWNDASQSFHALKWVAGDAAGLKLELDALRKFREVSQKLRSPNLIAIEHINLLPSGLVYTMPLADGMEGNDPATESWRPMTLADQIAGKNASWFSSAEILQIILPIIRATAALNGQCLVHRDIKPANVLFFGGVPCLADMGLLANDSASLTQRGTPGFLPPSWFLESGGQADAWGLATTLYTLLTGNNPDKMGRPKFLWPPAGKDSLTPAEQNEWKRLHAIIYRATHEKASERFRDFQTFAVAVEGAIEPVPRKKRGILGFVLAGVVLASVLAWAFLGRDRQPHSPTPADTGVILTFKTPEPESTPTPDPRGIFKSVEGNNNPFPSLSQDETILKPARHPDPTSEQGMSAARQQELDNEAAAITRKLEKRKDEIPENIFQFRELAQKIIGKMRSYNFGSPAFPDLGGKMKNFAPDASNRGADDPGTKELALAKLTDINNDLRKLLVIMPSPLETAEMQKVGRMYNALVNSAYAKTVTPDEKNYFADQIRSRLEKDFERIFKGKPDDPSQASIIVDMKMALTNLKLSDPSDKPGLSQIEAAVDQVCGLNRQ